MLNPNPFQAGGVMDEPDLQVRTAALRFRAGAPMSAQDFRRIAVRQGLERQNEPVGGQSTSALTTALRAANPGGIDVRSYTGSMWAPDGPMAARPLPAGAPRVGEPGGGIQVRNYTGSMFRGGQPVVGAGGGMTVPSGMLAPAGADPALAAAPDPRSVAGLLRGTTADPQEVDIRRQMQTTELEGRQLGNESVRRQFRAQDAESAAIATAVSPSVGLAEQIRGGARFEDLAPAGAVDRSGAYLAAGGRNPAMAAALFRDQPFEPTERTLPSGTRVIQNTPKSVIPDPQQRIETTQAGNIQYPRKIDAGGRSLIEVSPGKFTDDRGKPVAWRDDDRPLTSNEFMMSPSLADRFKGKDGMPDYNLYREWWAANNQLAPAADPKDAKPTERQPQGPKVLYKASDVQAELKRRGLTK